MWRKPLAYNQSKTESLLHVPDLLGMSQSAWVEAGDWNDEPPVASVAAPVFAALLVLLSVLAVLLLSAAARGFHPAAVWLLNNRASV